MGQALADDVNEIYTAMIDIRSVADLKEATTRMHDERAEIVAILDRCLEFITDNSNAIEFMKKYPCAVDISDYDLCLLNRETELRRDIEMLLNRLTNGPNGSHIDKWQSSSIP
jgi:hypothetical protein